MKEQEIRTCQHHGETIFAARSDGRGGIRWRCLKCETEAAKWCVENGLSKSKHSASNHIIDCCNGKLKSSMKYKWAYKNIPE